MTSIAFRMLAHARTASCRVVHVVPALRSSSTAIRTVAYSARLFSADAATTTATERQEGREETIIPGVGKGKTSTGYVGLAVEPDWYNVMNKKFQALLDKMEASDMPETAQYRIDVTKWCNFVLKTVAENPNNPEAVEDAVQMGQVEELIEMADDEMVALDTYLKSRMWEVVAQINPVIDFEPNPMADPTVGDEQTAEHLKEGMEAMKAKK